MKTTLFLTLGAVTLAALTISAQAGDMRLSPRAAENQIKVVKAEPAPAAAAVPDALSPRAGGNQLKTVSGKSNDANPYLACRKMMTGSPKAVAACADNPNMPACNPMTVAPLK